MTQPWTTVFTWKGGASWLDPLGKWKWQIWLNVDIDTKGDGAAAAGAAIAAPLFGPIIIFFSTSWWSVRGTDVYCQNLMSSHHYFGNASNKRSQRSVPFVALKRTCVHDDPDKGEQHPDGSYSSRLISCTLSTLVTISCGGRNTVSLYLEPSFLQTIVKSNSMVVRRRSLIACKLYCVGLNSNSIDA